MPRKVLLLTLLFLSVFASGVEVRAANAKELKRAEALVSKLKRLEEAAASRETGALRRVASKVYPGLFSSVSKLKDSDLKTDLSTAVALYDSAARDADTRAALDCSRELRESYSRLCREAAASSDGGRADLLAAKARLHTRFAEAELRHACGARDEATLETLKRIREERSTDIALAREALRALKELTGTPADSDKLEEVGLILASLPRGQVYTLLRNAFDASRDALCWQNRTLPSRALVVDVNSYASPDPLRVIDTRADEADRAILANQRAAGRFVKRAEGALSVPVNVSLR
ncbi:MAG TPA: hypothetical protein VGP08_03340 [Pyrinomonadaceae bacterium]|jgi:hypothetical protein|nr:hypothetical protein [Pyrinomonadaceae bacterium]